MDSKEVKQITAFYGKNDKRKLIFTVPLDFEVTEEYTVDKIKHKERTEAEEWLKRKGFEEERRGWSFYGDGEDNVKFPTTICCEETQRLHVKFHRIEGVKTLVFPIAYSKKHSGSDYKSLNEFPDYIDAKFMSFRGLNDLEKEVYKHLLEKDALLTDSPLEIDDYYFAFLVKNNVLDKVKVDLNRFQEDVFKLYNKEMYDALRSAKGIKKYSL